MKHTIVFGLSADPIHQAHIDIACDAVEDLIERGLPITKLLIVPVYNRNPTDPTKQLPAPYEDRFDMCQIAANEIIAPRLAGRNVSVAASRVDETLASRSADGKNYTVETLCHLKSRDEYDSELVCLIGSDILTGNSPEFSRWRQPERIVQLAVIAVPLRPGYEPNGTFLQSLRDVGNAKFIMLSKARDIKARDIRARIGNGEDPLKLAEEERLLPYQIAALIKERGLYQVRRK